MTNVTQQTARRVAELMLDSLGISPQDADKLQTIPYDQLRTAGEKAMAQAAREAPTMQPERVKVYSDCLWVLFDRLRTLEDVAQSEAAHTYGS